MHDNAKFVPALYGMAIAGRLKEIEADPLRPTGVLRDAMDVSRQFKQAVKDGLDPERQRLLAIDKIERLCERARKNNETKAAAWQRKVLELAEKTRSQWRDKTGRLHAISEGRLKFDAMSEAERDAVVGRYLSGDKHLTSLEIDLLSTYEHLRVSSIFGQLRERRAAIEENPELEQVEGRPYQNVARQYEAAGGLVEVEIFDEDSSETGHSFVALEQFVDLGDSR